MGGQQSFMVKRKEGKVDEEEVSPPSTGNEKENIYLRHVFKFCREVFVVVILLSGHKRLKFAAL